MHLVTFIRMNFEFYIIEISNELKMIFIGSIITTLTFTSLDLMQKFQYTINHWAKVTYMILGKIAFFVKYLKPDFYFKEIDETRSSFSGYSCTSP